MASGWVRRAGKGADPWGVGEPVNESTEAYRVRISGGIAPKDWLERRPRPYMPQAIRLRTFRAEGRPRLRWRSLPQMGNRGAGRRWN